MKQVVELTRNLFNAGSFCVLRGSQRGLLQEEILNRPHERISLTIYAKRLNSFPCFPRRRAPPCANHKYTKIYVSPRFLSPSLSLTCFQSCQPELGGMTESRNSVAEFRTTWFHWKHPRSSTRSPDERPDTRSTRSIRFSVLH